MKRICEWAMALLFSGVLLVLMAATILLPKNRYSYYENRNLSAFPEITAESVLSGQVFDDLETLFCDYAAWRTPALKAVTWADLNVFRRPVVNETVVTDDVLLPQLYDPAMSDDDIRAQVSSSRRTTPRCKSRSNPTAGITAMSPFRASMSTMRTATPPISRTARTIPTLSSPH